MMYHEEETRSKWIRAAWVGLAVATISIMGYKLNRFVADDNALAFAAASASSESSQAPTGATPVIQPTLPVVATAIKPHTTFPRSRTRRVSPAYAADEVPAQAVLPPAPADPDVPNLTLGERLDIRMECFGEVPGGESKAFQECFLRKLEEHPHPIHLE